jgi:hypothetical protein
LFVSNSSQIGVLQEVERQEASPTNHIKMTCRRGFKGTAACSSQKSTFCTRTSKRGRIHTRKMLTRSNNKAEGGVDDLTEVVSMLPL